MNSEEMGKKISQVLAKARTDAEFKEQLKTDPAGTLQAEGIELPVGQDAIGEDGLQHIIVELVDNDVSLSDEVLSSVTGGNAGTRYKCWYCGNLFTSQEFSMHNCRPDSQW